MIAQLILCSIAIFSRTTSCEALIYAVYISLNLALIPTPILIPIYFKPIRKQLCIWLSCCVLKKSMAKHMSKRSSTVEGSGSAHGPEKAMKVVV